MNSLDRLRQKVSPGIVALLWINCLLIALRNGLRPEGFDLFAVGAAVLVVASATVSWAKDRTGEATRIVTSMAHAATVALLVYSFSGSTLQIDMHMYFFASLAICSAWIDWRAIVGYAALVAAHHLILFFAIPLAVFPGESEFSRVVLHAVVLVVQSGVLIALTHSVVAAFVSSDKAVEAAQTAQRNAAEMTERAQAADRLAETERAGREAEKAQEAATVKRVVVTLASALSELSVGNVSYRISETFDGAFDHLRKSFNASLETLEATLLQVGLAAEHVRAGSGQISQANDDLSHRTERQAASVEETAASLSDVTNTVYETTKLAEEAGKMVGHALANAEKSGSIVTNAVGAMQRIEKSSSEISQIIGVIDEIAFQTNLLALNAGVEAARAGEAGKGFAVVAQEVRELAQRSANAAKEIKQLINTSGEHVKSGVQLVGETGQALQAIANEVKEISGHVTAIVKGARDQSNGLREISATIDTIDRNTQQNAAMVEESSAATHSLAKEAVTLEQLLERFHIGTTAPAGRQPAKRVA